MKHLWIGQYLNCIDAEYNTTEVVIDVPEILFTGIRSCTLLQNIILNVNKTAPINIGESFNTFKKKLLFIQ